jgi:aminoglycoside 6'-N-acetyltransferase
MVHFETGRLRVRDWEENDISFLAKWMSDPRVLQFFGGRDDPHDEARMRDEFFEATNDICCIFEWDGEPLGYIQFCPGAWPEFDHSPCQNVWSIDLYIGEPDYWHRGIGTQVVRAGAEYLLASGRADRVTIDPETWNTRAIRSYEKAGFAKWRFMPRAELHEGEMRDAWLMVFGLPAPRVVQLDELPLDAVEPLAHEATGQGLDFMRRLMDDYRSGANRFDKPGEALFGVYDESRLIGVGGLNIDAYANDPRISRVRHVYVLASHRRCGAGRALVTAIMSQAMHVFDVLRLRTNTREGAAFYESLGFDRLEDPSQATHAVRFGPVPAP